MFYVLFAQTTMLCMGINARGRHTKSPKTNKKLSFSTLSLENAFITTINKNYTRITIQLYSITKQFITRLCNYCTIVHKGTVYHSNWSSVGVMTSVQYMRIDCRNALRNISDYYRSIATWVTSSNRYMVVLAIKGLSTISQSSFISTTLSSEHCDTNYT